MQRRSFLGTLLSLLVPVKLDPVSKPLPPKPMVFVDFENSGYTVIADLVTHHWLPDGTLVTRHEFLEPITLKSNDTLKLNYILEYK